MGAVPAAEHSAAKPSRSLKPSRVLTPAQNRQPLSRETRGELSAFGTRLADCLAGGGVTLGEPRPESKEIVIRMRLGDAVNPAAFLIRMSTCDRELGKPPPGSAATIDRDAIQRGRGAIRLY
jgi:hypothetical protein